MSARWRFTQQDPIHDLNPGALAVEPLRVCGQRPGELRGSLLSRPGFLGGSGRPVWTRLLCSTHETEDAAFVKGASRGYREFDTCDISVGFGCRIVPPRPDRPICGQGLLWPALRPLRLWADPSALRPSDPLDAWRHHDRGFILLAARPDILLRFSEAPTPSDRALIRVGLAVTALLGVAGEVYTWHRRHADVLPSSLSSKLAALPSGARERCRLVTVVLPDGSQVPEVKVLSSRYVLRRRDLPRFDAHEAIDVIPDVGRVERA
jgi:hypothetical protein